MRKALTTFATGRHAELLALSRPLFRAYAQRHGYEYRENVIAVDHVRPASWLRLPILTELLQEYDEVLWLGADVVIMDGSEDYGATTPADAWATMVMHHIGGENVPNNDVMLLRPQLIPYLRRAWELTDYVYHPWWEQAAFMHLMGYDMTQRPYELTAPTEFYRHIHWMPLEWNSHESSQRLEHPRFAHATYGGIDWRLDVMRRRIAEAA